MVDSVLRRLLLLFLALFSLVVPNVGALAQEVTFEVNSLYNCIGVNGPDNMDIIVYLYGSNGELKGADYRNTSTYGGIYPCFPALVVPGDRIEAWWDFGRFHELVVPSLSVLVNRVTDVVSGVAPRFSIIKVQARPNFTSSPVPVTRNLTADRNGRFRTDFTDDHDILGGERVEVRWTSDQGDEVYDYFYAPAFYASYRSASIYVESMPNLATTLELRKAGAVIARVNGTADRDGYMADDVWRNPAGGVVPAEAGQLVIANFAEDASARIPTFALRAGYLTDNVNGRCIPNAPYRMVIEGTGVFAERYGRTGSDGRFSQDFATGILRPFHTATVFCRYPTGDTISRLVVAQGSP